MSLEYFCVKVDVRDHLCAYHFQPRDRKDKGQSHSYSNQSDSQYYYDRGGYSSSYSSGYTDPKSRDYYYAAGNEYDYDRRRPPSHSLNEPTSGRGGVNYRNSNGYYDSRGYTSAAAQKAPSYPSSSSYYSNYNSSAYYGSAYSNGGSYYGYSAPSFYYGTQSGYQAGTSSGNPNKLEKGYRAPTSLSDSPTRSRQYSFGTRKFKRGAASKLSISSRDSKSKGKEVKEEEKEPEKETIKGNSLKTYICFISVLTVILIYRPSSRANGQVSNFSYRF